MPELARAELGTDAPAARRVWRVLAETFAALGRGQTLRARGGRVSHRGGLGPDTATSGPDAIGEDVCP